MTGMAAAMSCQHPLPAETARLSGRLTDADASMAGMPVALQLWRCPDCTTPLATVSVGRGASRRITGLVPLVNPGGEPRWTQLSRG